MGNIVDYLKKQCGETVQERPLNPVDMLVLSQFAYLKYDGIVPGFAQEKQDISIAELEKSQDEAQVFSDERYEKDNRALFFAMAGSRRFRTMRVSLYRNIIDLQEETQFCAMTCFWENGPTVVVYRGTDETLVGWKEDFNMAFSRPVTGQTLSVMYLNQAALRIEGDFYVAGHSKGGNFAVYAAMNCTEEVQKRLLGVYSNDGPGFRPEVLNSQGFDRIRDRICKYIPQSSLVGMILQNQENYEVVESTTFGLMQHNPFTWKVEDGHFKMLADIHKGQRFMDESLNDWVLSLEEEQLEAFVETFYQVVSASSATTLIEFAADWKNCLKAVFTAMNEVDADTREKIRQIIKVLATVIRERFLLETKGTYIKDAAEDKKK